MVDASEPSQVGAGPTLRVALAHDWLVTFRGGERVLERLARLFGPTTIYTLVHSGATMAPAIDACEIHPSAMQRWPGAIPFRRWYLPLYPRAVESLRVEPEFDLLISTSSSLIKSIRPPIQAITGRPIPHLCYCHSPARYLWSRRADYGGGFGGFVRRAALAAAGPRLRRFDLRNCGVTTFIANSRHTADEIRRLYAREAVVIHPPIRTGFFTIDPTVEREDFYLVASALEPYKRIDLAIEAARHRRFRLVIAGDGSQASRLRRLARRFPNIEFTGSVSDETLRDLFRRAQALLFPGVEDFGMIPIEAMACGCPVIARDEGGARDWLRDGTGIGHGPGLDALLDALDRFEAQRDSITPGACRANAERFTETEFDRRILAVVDKIATEHRLASPTAPTAA